MLEWLKFDKTKKMEVENFNRGFDKRKYKVKLTLDLVVESIEGYDYVEGLCKSKIFFDNPSAVEVLEVYKNAIEVEEELPKTYSLKKEEKNV